MNITKDRLLEIEQELNGLTIQKMVRQDLLIGLINREYQCPHCNRPGKGNIFSLSHFDNCQFKGIDLTQLNEDILNYDDSVVQSKYGLSINPYKAYKKYHKIRKENYLVRGKRQGVLHHWSVSPRDSKGRAISKQK